MGNTNTLLSPHNLTVGAQRANRVVKIVDMPRIRLRDAGPVTGV
jgi:hypothetical protein